LNVLKKMVGPYLAVLLEIVRKGEICINTEITIIDMSHGECWMLEVISRCQVSDL
jgi:hypothetical protein